MREGIIDTDSAVNEGALRCDNTLVLQVRIAQLRSSMFDCSSAARPVMKKYHYLCTHNRGFTYSTPVFNEAYESKEDYRGFAYDNKDVPSVFYQRNSMSYTTYQVPRQYHTFPAPAYAVLIDPHKPREIAQAVISNLIANRYVDRQVTPVLCRTLL